MLVTLITLNWRNTASTTASSPASEPVCASAATWPTGLAPALSATIGLAARAAFSAARANRSRAQRQRDGQRERPGPGVSVEEPQTVRPEQDDSVRGRLRDQPVLPVTP